jgi:hypothetical protein
MQRKRPHGGGPNRSFGLDRAWLLVSGALIVGRHSSVRPGTCLCRRKPFAESLKLCHLFR